MLPKNRLRMTRIDRIALVDKGDNPKAHVVIHKRAPDAVIKSDALTFNDVLAQTKVGAGIWDYITALMTAVEGVTHSDAADKAALIDESVAQFVTALRAAMPAWLGQQENASQGTEAMQTEAQKAAASANAEIVIQKLTPTTVKKNAAVVPLCELIEAKVAELGADLRKRDPKLSRAAAEGQVWRERGFLSTLYHAPLPKNAPADEVLKRAAIDHGDWLAALAHECSEWL